MNAQRMTEEETQAVIRLWQAEQPGVADPPTLPDVAEGLDISVADAQRLLLEVRARWAEEERLLAREQAEAEWARIQLAEEERKLAEVRRQRAELQRQNAGADRQRHSPPRQSNTVGTVATEFGVGFLVLWLCVAIFIISVIASAIDGISHTASQPYVTTTCGPGFRPLRGHDASFGCVDTSTPMSGDYR